MIDILLKYYYDYGENDYIGEHISQKEHMIQAAMLAEENSEPIELVFACLFHDIGHLIQSHTLKMDNIGIKNHEKIGYNLLKKFNIPEPIPTLVKSHVNTKRYNVFKNKNYIQKLSDASKRTLILQGGIMTEDEAIEFEKEKYFDMFLKLRKYDDEAKVIGKSIKSLNYYKDLYNKYYNISK